MNKKHLIIGLVTGLGFVVFAFILSFMKYGDAVWRDEELREVLYLYPLWFLLMTYTGYGTAKYYYSQKALFVVGNKELTSDAKKGWINHLRWMYSRLLDILFKVFGGIMPLYVLAKIESFEFLPSSRDIVIALAILSLGCFAGSRLLKTKYEKELVGPGNENTNSIAE
ncbi:MAG: hypothetical protein ACK5KP_01175 [Paludibacteraceae bacterium]